MFWNPLKISSGYRKIEIQKQVECSIASFSLRGEGKDSNINLIHHESLGIMKTCEPKGERGNPSSCQGWGFITPDPEVPQVHGVSRCIRWAVITSCYRWGPATCHLQGHLLIINLVCDKLPYLLPSCDSYINTLWKCVMCVWKFEFVEVQVG